MYTIRTKRELFVNYDRKGAAALEDILKGGLDVVFVGYNPGMKSGETGHHYASASNRFWRLLHDSGLTDRLLHPDEDRKLLEYGYGSTNIVERATRSAAELKKEEYAAGKEVLLRKLQIYHPRIVCYTGIGVYRALTGIKDIQTGIQSPSLIPGIMDFVCSSPSGLNRWAYQRQLECFEELKSILTKTA